MNPNNCEGKKPGSKLERVRFIVRLARDKMNHTPLSLYVGIDVSKTQLDVAVGQDRAPGSASNDGLGIGRTLQQLLELQLALIVV
jgi:hypothetical protein